MFRIFLLFSVLLSVSCSPKEGNPTWQSQVPGVDLLEWEYMTPENIERELLIYRLAPAFFEANLALDIENDSFLSDWAQTTEGEFILFNGAFFTETGQPTAYYLLNGEDRSENIYDFNKSGFLYIQEGQIYVDQLSEFPVNSDFAFQSFPMLISDGQPLLNEEWDTEAHRRTAVGVDAEGNVYLILSNSLDLSLYEFQQTLQETEIPFTEVLNLDGGLSTGVIFNLEEYVFSIDSWAPVSNVVILTPRE